MDRIKFALVVAGIALLAWIGLELHGTRRELERWNAMWSPASLAQPSSPASTAAPETEQQRRERMYQEIKRHSEDLRWLLERSAKDRSPARKP